RYHTVVADDAVPTNGVEESGEHVNRQEVERVHQGNPDEYGQCQWSNKRAVTVNDGLGLVVDHFDDHFDRSLEAARYTGSGFACCQIHDQATQYPHCNRPEHRVEVDNGEIDYRFLVLGGKMPQVVD